MSKKKRAARKQVEGKLSDYIRFSRTGLDSTNEEVLASACKPGITAFKWLLKQEKAGKSVREICELAIKKHSPWYDEYILNNMSYEDPRYERECELEEKMDVAQGALDRLEVDHDGYSKPFAAARKTEIARLKAELVSIEEELDGINNADPYRPIVRVILRADKAVLEVVK